MEMINFFENGILMGLPAGFRFDPSDEELVFDYLHNKVMSLPMPANIIIPDFEVYKSDTWDFQDAGDSERTRYFFSKNEPSNQNGEIPNSFGYWKPDGIELPFMVSDGNLVIVAIKKVLVFYRGESPNGFQTNWIMHEFRLPVYSAADGLVVNPNEKMKLFEEPVFPIILNLNVDKYWVLTKVFRKKNVLVRTLFFSNLNNVAPASSDVSVVTHEPDRDQEEISSGKKL